MGPASAALYPGRTGVRPIGFDLVVVPIGGKLVPAPLPYVSGHIEYSELVGLFLAYRMDDVEAVLTVPPGYPGSFPLSSLFQLQYSTAPYQLIVMIGQVGSAALDVPLK